MYKVKKLFNKFPEISQLTNPSLFTSRISNNCYWSILLAAVLMCRVQFVTFFGLFVRDIYREISFCADFISGALQ